jgi:hypothetical protein
MANDSTTACWTARTADSRVLIERHPNSTGYLGSASGQGSRHNPVILDIAAAACFGIVAMASDPWSK